MKLSSKSKQNKSRKISVLLADDHPIIREALRNLLLKEDDIEVVGEAADGIEAVKLSVEKSPDIVIMDIGMPKLNGLEATRSIKTKCPKTEILALTVHDDSENILGILKAGASGYLTKSIFGSDVVQAIRTVISGKSVLTGSVLKQIINHSLSCEIKTYSAEQNNKFTIKELMILKLVAKGLSNKEIGRNMKISPLTVKGCLDEIFSKLGVNSRTEAAIEALQSGYLNLSELKEKE